MNINKLLPLILLFSARTTVAQTRKPGEESADRNDTAYVQERTSCHFQFTTIGQHQFAFHSPYTGTRSLLPDERLRVSLTSTLFLGARTWRGGEVYFVPEMSGGRGMSATNGVAGFPNGEVYRVGDPEPVITISRVFMRQTIALGDTRTNVESQAGQVRGTTPSKRIVITAGKFSIVDIFDANTYSHDPRSQFFNWSIMSACAWDYPANTRGYTYGMVVELIQPQWAVRVASNTVPEEANGPFMDLHYSQAHSETIQVDRAVSMHSRPGVVRLIAYNTFAHMGSYKQAVVQNPTAPDITMTRAYGRTKSGFAVNAEQELTDNIGVFGRLSWNDGQNETWAFTEIDRSLNIGMQLSGSMWQRASDKVGIALVANGLSDPHRQYLASGGYGFIIGDGRLNYGSELIAEVYYSGKLFNNFWVSPDYQFIIDPAYNKDRGPVHVVGVRGHVEF